jgi:molybdopterin-containing oxidoreductase family molybdopterin binding subunit
MANQMVQNGWYDKEFLLEQTIATYLVDVTSGKLARDADGNYLVWDESANAPVAVAPGKGAIAATQPAFLGSFSADGASVKPVFQLLTDHLASYTPEYAEKISQVPAARVAALAKEYADAANTYIVSAYGMRYTNSGEAYRALHLLGTLKGAFGRPGSGVQTGGQLGAYPIVFNDTSISMPEGVDGRRPNGVRMGDFFALASSDESPYRAFISPAGNPVHQQPHRDRWLKIFEKMELVVDFDIWMTDTGELADYVLPDCMPFERMDIISAAQYNHVVLQEPAIEPPPGVRDPVFLWSELGKRVGFGEFFNKTTEEWLAGRLETDYPLIAGLEPKLTFERLKQEKCVRTLAPVEPKFDPFAGLQFATATGRIEFYAERLVPVGRPLPLYVPCFESPVIDGNAEYPYQLFTGRQRFFMQSMFTEDPINIELSGGKPTTRINPTDAAEKGLKDGDKVEVYNQRGHVVTELEIDESVPPKTIHVWFGWRRRQFEVGTYSEMVTPISGPGIIDEVADKWWNDWYEQFKTMWGSEDIMAFETGGWDAYWDCACNVRAYAAGKEA